MIISLSGKIGSGKDTVCKIIQSITNGDRPEKIAEIVINNWVGSENKFENKKWAYKLKQICGILTGKTAEDFESQELKDSKMSPEWYLTERATTRELLSPKWDYENLEEARDRGWFEESPNNFIRINKNGVPTYRWLLQTVGTEAMRNNIHQNVWVNALMADYKPKYVTPELEKLQQQFPNQSSLYYPSEGTSIEDSNYPNWIITDTRFPNEVKAVKDRAGIVIRVDRVQLPIDPNKGLIGTLQTHMHPSETALDDYKDWDYEIDNNGTIEDLIENVRKVLIVSKIITV